MRYFISLLLIFCITDIPTLFGQSKVVLPKSGYLVQKLTDSETGAIDSINLVLVKGGSFDMGSNDKEEEQPVHRVTVNSFYMAIYEITQEQWGAVMGYNYSDYQKCNKCAMDVVSWDHVQEFLTVLNKKSGKHFRLPTEAEWEYAAKGGRYSGHYKYSGSNNINDVAIFGIDGNWEGNNRTHPVGEKKPNELGIYDMCGNILEWCSDWYDVNYYAQKANDNPKGPTKGTVKVIRGGFFASYPWAATNTYRFQDPGHYAYPYSSWRTLGFRVVCDVQ